MRWGLSVIFLCGVLTGCGSILSSEGYQNRITITGSSTIAPLAAEMGQRLEKENPALRVEVQTGGSSRGVADVKTHLAEIGMVSRDLTTEELQSLIAFPIAKDGVCLIVHASNSVTNLTEQQVQKIYTKQIANWQEVGGADQSIVVVHKAEGRSTLEIFLKFFALENKQVQPDNIIGDNQQGLKLVAQTPGAIGYVSIGSAQFEAEQGMSIKLLPAGGVAASVENVANGTFPIARTLHLVTAKDAPLSEPARQFLEFAQSVAVHDLIEGLQFVPLRK